MKIHAVYTLYDISVPFINHTHYLHFLNKLPEMDVSDFNEEERILSIGINYDSKQEQEKLLQKLTQELEDYYRR